MDISVFEGSPLLLEVSASVRFKGELLMFRRFSWKEGPA
jgi:hypothetical protein